MNRLLGLHVNGLAAGLPELLATWRPPVVVTMASGPIWTWLKSISPGTRIVFRDQSGESLNPDFASLEGSSGTGETYATVARRRVQHAIGVCRDRRYDYLQLVNEPAIADRAALARLASFEIEAMQVAAAQGFRLAIGGFAAGQPKDISWWEAYYPALRAGREYGASLLLHEYNFPALQSEDALSYSLRHRRVYASLPQELRLPLIVGECGLNAAVHPGESGGWLGTVESGEYARQLEIYDAELRADAYVLGAAIYCVGRPGRWREFNIWPEPAATLARAADPLYRTYSPPTAEPVVVVPVGVDVSKHQGPNVDWRAVADAGVSFAILRASVGCYRDAIYVRNVERMDPRITVSAYHYVTSKDAPETQVSTMQGQLRLCPAPAWADLEDNGLTDAASRAFVEGLEQALGAPVGIYTSWYKSRAIKLGRWAAEHPLWVADWRDRPKPQIPSPWAEANRTYTYWQYTVAPSYPGFAGRVDLNRAAPRITQGE